MARNPFPWPVNHFSTAFTRHSTALLLPLVPSSILPNIVDLPSQYNGESCLFFTCDLPSNQFIAPFHPFIPSSDARCSTSPTTSPTTPPHPLWSTMHTAMHTYMVSVLPSVASSPLYVPLPSFSFSHCYAACPNLDPSFPHAEASLAALSHGLLPRVRSGIPVPPPLASPWEWRQW